MHLIYFDECKNDAAYPHYHLSGMAISEDDLADIEGRINEISTDVYGSVELGKDTEFHAVEIYHRKGRFKDWADFGKRLDVLSRFIDILSLATVKLIDVQINCALLTKEQEADEIAFMFFCERANDLMRSSKSVGMMIGDRESDFDSARFATALSAYRATGTDFSFGRDIKNLVDSVHFTHSHLSRFLQLADVYVWLQQFMLRNRGSENERHKALFSVLQRKSVNLFPAKYKEWPKS
jgi:hypothetical protein